MMYKSPSLAYDSIGVTKRIASGGDGMYSGLCSQSVKVVASQDAVQLLEAWFVEARRHSEFVFYKGLEVECLSLDFRNLSGT